MTCAARAEARHGASSLLDSPGIIEGRGIAVQMERCMGSDETPKQDGARPVPPEDEQPGTSQPGDVRSYYLGRSGEAPEDAEPEETAPGEQPAGSEAANQPATATADLAAAGAVAELAGAHVGYLWAGRRRPGTVRALLALLIVQALGAIGGGIGLVQDPVNNIGLSVSLLDGTPFHDFLIPGLILLIVVGLFPVWVLYGLFRRRRWGWWLSLAAGFGLIIWIIVEGVLLGYLPGAGIGLQIVFGLVGLFVVILTLARRTRDYYGAGS